MLIIKIIIEFFSLIYIKVQFNFEKRFKNWSKKIHNLKLNYIKTFFFFFNIKTELRKISKFYVYSKFFFIFLVHYNDFNILVLNL